MKYYKLKAERRLEIINTIQMAMNDALSICKVTEKDMVTQHDIGLIDSIVERLRHTQRLLWKGQEVKEGATS